MKQMRLTLIYLIAGILLNACSNSSNNSASVTPAQNSGLSNRPPNTSCLASGYTQSSNILLTRAYPNLNFNSPLLMLQSPGNNARWYVLEKGGRVIWFDATNSNTSTINTVVNFPTAGITLSTCNECGLLGMAFHPNFASNGYIYFSFTAPESNPSTPETMQSFVSRFTSSDGGLSINIASRLDVLNVLQPYANHNGGHIAFGADGLLYVGLGDGGSGNDPPNNGQDINTLLGSLLRLNDNGSPAAGNLVSAQGGRPEIYAFGLRNPWRWSFDRQTNELWLADVGQNQYEEVDIIINGGNYGWRCYEGYTKTSNNCSTTGPYISPVAEYNHSEGNSITGGYVYRGSNIPSLNGVYIFGDFGSGNIWGLFPQSNNQYTRTLLRDTAFNISSFAESNSGELFVIHYGGQLYQIDPDTSTPPPSAPPQNLINTGCVSSNNPSLPASGLIPFAINEPFWSDGAEKERFMALPNNTTINVNSEGDFEFPIGSVLLKNFRLNNVLIETRLFMHEQNGQWRGYSYQWNSQQSSATLLNAATDVIYGAQTWHFPSAAECLLCHTSAAYFTLGPELRQLNRDFTYPSTGITANQLSTLQHIGVIAPNNITVSNNPLASSLDTNQALSQGARSYLHSNCSHCHRPGGTSLSAMDLRVSTAFTASNVCNTTPQNGNLGIPNAVLFAPGEPDRSLLLQRINTLSTNRMPPTSSTVIDTASVQLIRDWILQTTSCS